MESRRKAALVSLVALGTAGAVAAVPPAASAAGGGSAATVVTKRLDGPFGLQEHLLARLHVGPDMHDQSGVGVDAVLFESHARNLPVTRTSGAEPPSQVM